MTAIITTGADALRVLCNAAVRYVRGDLRVKEHGDCVTWIKVAGAARGPATEVEMTYAIENLILGLTQAFGELERGARVDAVMAALPETDADREIRRLTEALEEVAKSSAWSSPRVIARFASKVLEGFDAGYAMSLATGRPVSFPAVATSGYNLLTIGVDPGLTPDFTVGDPIVVIRDGGGGAVIRHVSPGETPTGHVTHVVQDPAGIADRVGVRLEWSEL